MFFFFLTVQLFEAVVRFVDIGGIVVYLSNKSHVQTILVIVICFHQMFHISSFLSETTKKIV
jgi:hypothetical protein